MQFTLKFPSKLARVMTTVASEENIDRAELIRRAVITYAVLHHEVGMGKTIALLKDGEVEKELVFKM